MQEAFLGTFHNWQFLKKKGKRDGKRLNMIAYVQKSTKEKKERTSKFKRQ